MADLAQELRRLADAAAGQAVPLPAAEVMRRGSLRRRRRTTRQAISVLAIAGVVTTAVLTGAATRIVGKTAPGPTAPAARSGCTLLVTTGVPAAHMTVCVSYTYDHGGDVQLQAVSASYQSDRGYIDPYFGFVFRSASVGLVDDHFSAQSLPQCEGNAVRACSSGWIAPAGKNGNSYFHGNKGRFQPNEELIVNLRALNADDVFFTVTGIEVSLTRPGFACPGVGTVGGIAGGGIASCS